MLTNAFIRDLREAIGDVIDEHADIFAELRGGLDLCTDMTEGAILAAQHHLQVIAAKEVHLDDELIDAIDKHGFVFWVCPNKCKGIVKWNESKTEATCMECGTKSNDKPIGE